MYKVNFYKGNYATRQNKANMDKAVAYVEHHFNSSSSDTASYAVVVTGSNASPTSKTGVAGTPGQSPHFSERRSGATTAYWSVAGAAVVTAI